MRSFNLNDEEVIGRIRNDPKFFLENFTKMKTKLSGLQRYTLKPHQVDLINGIMENERLICLKARQMGCSTVIVGLFYHNTIFNAGFNTALIGYNSSLAKEFMEKVKTFYRTTPDRFKPVIEYNSKEEMSFPKLESKIFLLTASDNLARGWTLHRALCVSGDTVVYEKTDENVFKKVCVKDLQPNVEIINGDGGVSRVKKVIRKKNKKEMLKVKTYNGDPLVLTSDHKVLTLGGDLFTGEWCSSRDINLNTYIGYPKSAPYFVKNSSEYIDDIGIYWDRVESISNADFEYYVYDIVLDSDPHSFLTQGGIVHNCSELPFWENADDKMQAVKGSVAIDIGRLVVESTPSTVSSLFYQMWINPDNGYVKKEYGWWWEYTEDQIAKIKKDMSDPDRFAQEFELMFTASGRSVFDTQTILKNRKNELHIGDPVVSDDLDGIVHYVVRRPDGLVMYKNPRKDHQYVMGVDVAEGLHDGDYSCVIIIDRTDQEEVAFYKGHASPDHFGQMLNDWGRMYNEALAVVEVNGHGITTLVELKNLFYPSIYFRPSRFEGMSQDMSNKIGWRTTQLTRPLMLDDFRRAFRDGDLTLHSKEIFDECSTFIFDESNNMRAERGAHDDTIMATAVAIQGFKSISREKLTQLNETSILPMNFCY